MLLGLEHLEDARGIRDRTGVCLEVSGYAAHNE